MAITVSRGHHVSRVRRCSDASSNARPLTAEGAEMPQDIVEVQEVPAEELPELALMVDIPF
ncbi:hypothetical protein V7793_35770, partial [Streptomyces sp. KLMMK]|uniref:hypothetical protein n=1 Tax=Streptomyces sp. KLMMK TaxID=3109353 RepID=UPI003008BC68